MIFELVTLGLTSTPLVTAQQTPKVPPWEYQDIELDWNLPSSNIVVSQCTTVPITIQPASGTTITLQPPFTLTFFRAGNEPYVFPVQSPTASGRSYTYDWTIQLPAGGPYQIMLTDSNGAIGGPIAIDSVTGENPPGACTLATLIPSTLNINFNGTDTGQCAEMPVQVTGGAPPYTFIVIEQWQFVKTTLYSTGKFYYTVDAQYGNKIIFAVTDSIGRGAVGDLFQVTQSSIVNCTTLASTVTPLSPAQTSIYQGLQTISTYGGRPCLNVFLHSFGPDPTTESHTGAIVGGVVGGVTLLLLAAIGGGLWHRKRSRDAHRRDCGLDLFDPAEPVSEPATGYSVVAPTPYSYVPSPPISEAGFAGLGTVSQHKYAAAPAEHTRGSSYYETFPPIGDSPPYTAIDVGSSTNPWGSNRISGESFATSDRDLMGIHSRVGSPMSQRVGGPPLPPGAAAPSTFVGVHMPVLEEHEPDQFEFTPNHLRSPPPTY
ncbi:hypothetical protein FRB98_002351 [Tulasnella sp. 332]|nr:hypothetical protein FRB98_002351 [Tulasnella sp. 332]